MSVRDKMLEIIERHVKHAARTGECSPKQLLEEILIVHPLEPRP